MNNSSRRRICIFIADEHKIFRDGLKGLLAEEKDFVVVGEASDGDKTLEAIRDLKPDVLLLELSLRKTSGIDVLHSIAELNSDLHTIMLVAEINEEQIREAFNSGTRGIVLKESPASMLFESIRAIKKGLYWIGNTSVADSIEALKHVDKLNATLMPTKNFGLTPRELEITAEVISGYTNREIAEKFSISQQTVKHHLSNIFDKLGVYNRVELALFALHHNIIDPSDG